MNLNAMMVLRNLSADQKQVFVTCLTEQLSGYPTAITTADVEIFVANITAMLRSIEEFAIMRHAIQLAVRTARTQADIAPGVAINFVVTSVEVV